VLFEAYPDMKDVVVSWHIGPSSEGKYATKGFSRDKVWNSTLEKYVPTISVSGKTWEEAKSHLIHETQHQIQRIENFGKGGSPDYSLMTIQELTKKQELDREISKLWNDPVATEGMIVGMKGEPRWNLSRSDTPQKRKLIELWHEREELLELPSKRYSKLAGEYESRDAASRMDLTAEERKAKQPYTSEDLSPKDLIVRMEGGGAAMSVETPKKRPRKFLKTVEKAADTDPELIELTNRIDPQDYLVQPNKNSLAKVEKRIDENGIQDAIDFALSDAPVSAEKGATFITLMRKFQQEGDYDRAVEMVEAYDTQLREAGRFVQAASLWNRLTAQGFIRWANKQLEATRQKYGWADTILNNKPESFTLSKG